tara:strand:- start:629 stop:901 length:273 start_codon:yes stop_codon:yes gene_type:complete
MNTDDFINKDFKNQEFRIDQGVYQLQLLRLNIENKYYLINLMANQIRIKGKLDKMDISDEEVNSQVMVKLEKIEESINMEYNHRLADILK